MLVEIEKKEGVEKDFENFKLNNFGERKKLNELNKV